MNRGAICIVEPTYKTLWHFPGGTIEADESPSSGCDRELREELGLNMPLKRLLCIDWLIEDDDPHGALQFIYDGGVLTSDTIDSITLPPDELRSARFVAHSLLSGYISERNQLRLDAALRALTDHVVIELDRESTTDTPG